jgi:uncharacterized protein (DUF433 family)
MNGRPCLRDTHVAVATVISLLASGRNETEVVRRFPALSLNDIREALTYAAWEIDPTETAVHPISPEAARPIVPPLPRYLQPPVHHPLVPPTAPDAASAPVPAAPAPDERLEFFHPSRPDRPTVMLSSHGIIDRRWSTGIIAWSDIRDIRRVTGEKTIVVTLRNPRSEEHTQPEELSLLLALPPVADRSHPAAHQPAGALPRHRLARHPHAGSPFRSPTPLVETPQPGPQAASGQNRPIQEQTLDAGR